VYQGGTGACSQYFDSAEHRNETDEDPYSKALSWEDQCFTGRSGNCFGFGETGTESVMDA